VTAPTTALVCGCIRGVAHSPDCRLGQAKQIAVTAAATAPRGRGRRLIAALTALAQAGLLDDLAADGLVDNIEALLDTLWELRVIDDGR